MQKEKMKSILRIIDRFFDGVGVLFLFAMFFLTVLQVFYRYVLSNPLPWPEEIARYLFIWITYIGLVKNTREEDHFKIDFLLLKLSRRNKAVVQIVFYALILWFLITTGLGSIGLLRANRHILSANFISVNVVYASLPIMSIFMVVHIIGLVFRKFRFLLGRE